MYFWTFFKMKKIILENIDFIEHRSPNRPRVLVLYQFGYVENDEHIYFLLFWGPYIPWQDISIPIVNSSKIPKSESTNFQLGLTNAQLRLKFRIWKKIDSIKNTIRTTDRTKKIRTKISGPKYPDHGPDQKIRTNGLIRTGPDFRSGRPWWYYFKSHE